MGGGFVMIPLLANVQKLTQHQAHATSLCAVMATGVAGAVSYKEHGMYAIQTSCCALARLWTKWFSMDLPKIAISHTSNFYHFLFLVLLETAVAIATTGMLSARFGANLTRGVSERALRQALGALMLAVAPMVPLKAQFIKANETTKVSVSPATTAGAFNQQQQLTTILPAAACIGLASGFLAGTFGVGGGVVVVPALCWVCDATHHQALGTSLAAMILPAAVGTYTHYKAGAVVLRVAPALACGALVGAYVGGRVAVMADEAALQWGFSGLLAVLGARTLLRA
jgi:uncharacterized membrane protein YfcA